MKANEFTETDLSKYGLYSILFNTKVQNADHVSFNSPYFKRLAAK
jgi:hypothetical protein